MDFDEWYKALSPTLQQYVKTFAFNPTERNEGFITDYLKASLDYGFLSISVAKFWFKWSRRVIEGTECVDDYFG
jgi:hypothetical protein